MLTLAVVSAMLVYGLIAAMLGTIVPDLSRKFSLTSKQLGQMGLAQAAGLIGASLAAGPLIGWSSKKAALVGAMLVVAAGVYALERAASYRSALAALFVIDCAGGTIVEAANSMSFEMGSALSEMMKANLLNASFCVGGVLTGFIGANFCAVPVRVLRFLFGAALGSLALNLMNPIAGGGAAATSLLHASAVTGTGAFWLVCLLFLFAIAAEIGMWNWLVPHLIAQGISARSALNILSLGFAAGLLAGRMIVVPMIPPSVPTLVVTLAAALAMTVATFFMTRVTSRGAASAVVFGAGVAMGPVFPNCIAITNTTFGNDPTALGLALMAGWIGMAVSSRTIGALAGDGGLRLRNALLVVPGASLLLAGACGLLMR